MKKIFKKMLKKIYKALPKKVTQFYKKARKHIMLRFVFPMTYKHSARGKEIQDKKVVFVEIRYKKIVSAYQLVYDRLIAEGYDVHVQYIQNISPNRWAYIGRCIEMLKDISDAHYVFLNDGCNITSCVPMRKETVVFQLWHACGAFKKFGMSTADLIFGDNRKNQERYPNYRNITYVSVSSPEIIWAYREAMNLDGTDTQVIPAGVSRTDVFYDKDFIENAKEQVYAVCPQARDKKIILYAPTFRGRIAKAKTPDCLDIPAMKEAFGDEYVLLLKHHPLVKKRPKVPEEYQDFAMDITKDLDIEQLLCVSDICISDYSSLIFEYSLFERPMIFYAYDLDNYFDWRGFYYNYDELTPGPIVTSTEEIIDYIQNLDTRFDKAEVHAFREKFMSACDGHATDRIVELVHNN